MEGRESNDEMKVEAIVTKAMQQLKELLEKVFEERNNKLVERIKELEEKNRVLTKRNKDLNRIRRKLRLAELAKKKSEEANLSNKGPGTAQEQ